MVRRTRAARKTRAGRQSPRKRSPNRGAPAAQSRASPRGPPQSKRAREAADRRAAILDAALEEFAARGFADTRLDDVAARAGIAKGTIYLYFRDKESLFQELVRAKLSPLIREIAGAAAGDLPIRALAQRIIDTFVNEIFATRRRDVVRLIITEGSRFPGLAEFYYREVIAHVLPLVRKRLAQAVAQGELAHDALARFPQLLVAPALMAIVWSALFGRFERLDVRALMRAHLQLLFGDEP